MSGVKYKVGQILEQVDFFDRAGEPCYWEVIDVFDPPLVQILESRIELKIYGKIRNCSNGTVEAINSVFVNFLNELPEG